MIFLSDEDRPALMLRWEKVGHHPKVAKTKQHTKWAKKNNVRRSKYIHWGGHVYAFWRFGSEGALMAFRLEDDLWDAVVDTPDPVDLWCKMCAGEYERTEFRRAIYHDFEHRTYRDLATRIAQKSKVGPIPGFFDHPWEVSANSLTGAFGKQAERIMITETVKPDGSKVTTIRVRGTLEY